MPQGYTDVALPTRKSNEVGLGWSEEAAKKLAATPEPPKDQSARLSRRSDYEDVDAPGLLDRMAGNVRDLAGGVRSSAARTVYGGGDLIRRGWNTAVPERFETERIIEKPEVQAAMRAPESAAGTVGSVIGDAAQFAVPLTRVSKAMQGAGLVKRAVVDAATSAGVAGVQSAGDPSTMGVAAAGGAVLPFAGAAARGVGRTVSRAAHGAKEGGLGGAVASAARTVAPGDPRILMIQAIKPRATRARFPAALDRAMPLVDEAAEALGRPIQNLDDLATATTAAKRTVAQQLDQVRGVSQSLEVDLSPVSDAMARSIPRKLRLESPATAQRLEEAAEVYRRRFSLPEAEQLLKETNAEMEAFYSKFPTAQRRALTADPEWARLDAQAKALRSAIDGALDRVADGGGATAKELRRRYGALMELDGEVERRVNVARRQQPDSLAEQIATASGMADRAAGIYRMGRGVATGSPAEIISGGADLVRGQVRRETAKFLREQQTTDSLIRRAFEAHRQMGRRLQPVNMPRPRRIAGALPAGPSVPPPPVDPSFVRGVPAMRSTSERLALPPPAARPMPAAETSGVTAVAARRTVQRDPRTGQMRRVYLSEP